MEELVRTLEELVRIVADLVRTVEALMCVLEGRSAPSAVTTTTMKLAPSVLTFASSRRFL